MILTYNDYDTPQDYCVTFRGTLQPVAHVSALSTQHAQSTLFLVKVHQMHNVSKVSE